jgi:hypothetical protein
MPTTFRPHPNNVSTSLASAYSAGGGSLVLAAGTGAAFGSTFPMTVTVAQAANVGTTAEVNTIFTVTGRTTDTLTGVTAAEGTTDRAYAAGDRVEVRWTGGLATAIETAVNGVENSTGITAGVIAPARLGTGTPGSGNWLRGDGAWVPRYNNVGVTNGNRTIGPTETLCWCDATAGNLVLTMPSAAAVGGQEFLFVRADSSANTITLTRAGTDQFWPGGTTTLLLPTTNGKYLRMMAFSSLWVTVGSN